MKTTRVLFVLVVALLVAAPCANAQLTVSTDKTEYFLGENVRITIHNGGPTTAMFASVPFYAVRRLRDGECFYGCLGLPVISWMAPRTTEISDFPTSLCAGDDPFGLYEIHLGGVSGDPGSVLTTTFLIYDVLEVEPHTWGAVKSLYRP